MRAHSVSDPLGAATARVQFETPRTVNVPLFRSLIEVLDQDRRWVVLDLGPARPQTVALLGRFRCRLDIADLMLADSLADTDDRVLAGELAAQLGAIQHPEPTDIALCWDFLNYLEPGQITTLMRSVAARCRPGALVHALIVYSDRLMQQCPAQLVPIDEGRLFNRSTAKPERIAPRYSPEELCNCMPGFSVERARLLTNGMQEYLFRFGQSDD